MRGIMPVMANEVASQRDCSEWVEVFKMLTDAVETTEDDTEEHDEDHSRPTITGRGRGIE